MNKLLFTLLILVFGQFIAVDLAMAQDKPQAMIVFDASGSMWGQIKGTSKINIAKKALNKVVSDWDENVQLGLIAYGQVNKKDMIAKVKQIKPKGKTPISRSIKKAAEGLRYTEEKATVILISDGKETCDADPCATAKSLEEEGIDFVAHVIGFDVDKQTDEQLKCIADSTGGEYFSAKDASALNDAMGKIAEKVKKEEPKPPVVKKPKYSLQISASETEGGENIRAYHVTRIDTGDEDEIGRTLTTCNSDKDDPCIHSLPVGKYIIESSYNQLELKTPVEIVAGKTTAINIVMKEPAKAASEEGISASVKEPSHEELIKADSQAKTSDASDTNSETSPTMPESSSSDESPTKESGDISIDDLEMFTK